jgi:hypothetical protein
VIPLSCSIQIVRYLLCEMIEFFSLKTHLIVDFFSGNPAMDLQAQDRAHRYDATRVNASCNCDC